MQADSLADRISAREVCARKGLVDHDYRILTCALGVTEETPLEKGCAHGGKVVWACFAHRD